MSNGAQTVIEREDSKCIFNTLTWVKCVWKEERPVWLESSKWKGKKMQDTVLQGLPRWLSGK